MGLYRTQIYLSSPRSCCRVRSNTALLGFNFNLNNLREEYRMIFTRGFAVSFVVLLALVVLSASTVFAADMFSGMWKVNIAKSTFNPGPPPKGPNTFEVTAVSNGQSVVTDSVNSTGQKTHTEYTFQFDGKDYPHKATLDGKPNPNAPDTIS